MRAQDRLRADAVRNRERILAAADQVFAESGIATDIATVARRAAVGNATVFRCFPSKAELIAAVVEHGLQRQLVAVRAAIEHTQGDAHAVLGAMLAALLQGHFGSRCIAEAAHGSVPACSTVGAYHAGIAEALDEIIARGHADGSIRADVATTDVVLLVAAMARHGALAGAEGDALCRRGLRLILDGLRPGHDPLPGTPPGWEVLSAGCA